MTIRAICAPLMFLMGGLLFAQTQPADLIDRTFHLGVFHTPQDLQEMATVLRTVTDITRLSIDSVGPSMTITADAEHLAVSEWVLKNLDQQPGDDAARSARFKLVTEHSMPVTVRDGEQFVRIFYLANNPTPMQAQELITVLRTVGNVAKIFNYSDLKAIVARGTKDRLQIVEWILSQLDAPGPPSSGAARLQTAEFQIPSIQIVYFSGKRGETQPIQETMTAIRTAVDDLRCFNYSRLGAVIFGGSAAQTARATKIIQDRMQPAVR